LYTEDQLQIMSYLGFLIETFHIGLAMGFLLLLSTAMGLFGTYLYQQKCQILANERHFALLGLLLVLVAGIAKLLSLIPWEGALYLTPVALATMLIAILLDVQVAIMAARSEEHTSELQSRENL